MYEFSFHTKFSSTWFAGHSIVSCTFYLFFFFRFERTKINSMRKVWDGKARNFSPTKISSLQYITFLLLMPCRLTISAACISDADTNVHRPLVACSSKVCLFNMSKATTSLMPSHFCLIDPRRMTAHTATLLDMDVCQYSQRVDDIIDRRGNRNAILRAFAHLIGRKVHDPRKKEKKSDGTDCQVEASVSKIPQCLYCKIPPHMSDYNCTSMIINQQTSTTMDKKKKKNHPRGSRWEVHCSIVWYHARSHAVSAGQKLQIEAEALPALIAPDQVYGYHKIEQCSSHRESRGLVFFFFFFLSRK